jgi:hypothetical protein
MTPNQSLAEGLAILDSISPISQGAGTVTTGWVSAGNFHSIMALVQTGIMGASATLDAKIQQAQDSGGTGAKDVPGKAIVQIVKASGDGKQALINMRDTDLDTTNGFSYVRLSMTVGTAASLISGTLFGGNALFEPVKDAGASPAINLGSANVVQIIQ